MPVVTKTTLEKMDAKRDARDAAEAASKAEAEAKAFEALVGKIVKADTTVKADYVNRKLKKVFAGWTAKQIEEAEEGLDVDGIVNDYVSFDDAIEEVNMIPGGVGKAAFASQPVGFAGKVLAAAAAAAAVFVAPAAAANAVPPGGPNIQTLMDFSNPGGVSSIFNLGVNQAAIGSDTANCGEVNWFVPYFAYLLNSTGFYDGSALYAVTLAELDANRDACLNGTPPSESCFGTRHVILSVSGEGVSPDAAGIGNSTHYITSFPNGTAVSKWLFDFCNVLPFHESGPVTTTGGQQSGTTAASTTGVASSTTGQQAGTTAGASSTGVAPSSSTSSGVSTTSGVVPPVSSTPVPTPGESPVVSGGNGGSEFSIIPVFAGAAAACVALTAAAVVFARKMARAQSAAAGQGATASSSSSSSSVSAGASSSGSRDGVHYNTIPTGMSAGVAGGKDEEHYNNASDVAAHGSSTPGNSPQYFNVRAVAVLPDSDNNGPYVAVGALVGSPDADASLDGVRPVGQSALSPEVVAASQRGKRGGGRV